MEINYNIQSLEVLTDEYLAAILGDFILTKQPKLVKLKDYYRNKTDIENRTKPETYMPNNKVATNFQRYITDIETGYFLGDPIKYEAPKDENLLEKLIEINRMSSEGTHNARLSKEASKTGVAYELIYLNANKEIRLANLPSENTFVIRDNSIEDKVLAAVNIIQTQNYITNKLDVLVNVYTKYEIKTYLYIKNKLNLLNLEPHYLADVPIIEYRNSDEAIGSYEDHLSTIDVYNMITSDIVNDIEQFANAIMVISADNLPNDVEVLDDEGNVISTKTVAQVIKNTRTLFIGAEDSATYLHKPSDNPGALAALERFKADLLMLTGVPDFGEGLSGNLSAAAIKNALFAFEQRLKNKENNFKAALNHRLELLVDLINFKHNTSHDYLDVKYVFTLNAPDSFTDSIAFAKDTEGLLSERTRIGKLVKDVDAEIDLKNKEKETCEIEGHKDVEVNSELEEIK